MDDVQPIWGANYLKHLKNYKMALNLSRGKPIKYYSSDRISQLMGNGLLTFIHKNTKYDDFFTKKEMVFYKNLDDLANKIKKYCRNDEARKEVANNGHYKYHKYFNSDLIAKYIIDKTLGNKFKFYWET